MSLHRITAGSGYDYLTRQVAAMDSTEKGHTGLASYYTEKGETPGEWMGSGMAGIDGLNAGDLVTSGQMQALYGSGHHPLAAERKAALTGRGLTEKDYVEATRLGQPFNVYDNDVSPFRIEVARRLEALNKERGLPRKASVAIEDRARIRTEVGLEMFRAERGRDPLDERELAGHIAKLSRQQTTAVAGWDLTFSPVKSVSTLWALADQQTAATIEKCHRQAVADALRFIEENALFTRTGHGGVRQVEVRGLVAAAFTHRDSRAGDPDLHTHVAVANKVQTLDDGRWLSIDGRVLHKAAVTASETYNSSLERHLAEALGVRFAARAGGDPRKRPVRELVGVDPALNELWSTRRHSIEARRRELAAQFQRSHGRPPTPVEAIALAQQATLETREAKHEPRTLAEQRAAWWEQARQALGGERRIQAMIHLVLRPDAKAGPRLDDAWLEEAAATVVAHVQAGRSSWQTWHLHAEALRAVRVAQVPAANLDRTVEAIVDRAIARCEALSRPVAGEPSEPDLLRRSDGSSVYTVAGSQLYTSAAVLAAEGRVVAAAGRRGGMVVPGTAIDLALLESEANGITLNPGQVLLVREMATSGARVQMAIAPAGSGKTTAMSALSRAWVEGGGNVLGLAPSAAAAAGLGDQLVGKTDTLAKLIWDLGHGAAASWKKRIGPKTLVVIDEAGMADTLSLDAAVDFILDQGGSVRLIGDDQQLAAIGAGGVLRDIQASHGALRLTELRRFSNPAEGMASLSLRQGETAALGFYLDQRRVHVGDETTMADDLFAAWSADRAGGLDSIMLAPTRELVADLNRRARSERLAGTTAGRTVDLPDGNLASTGDTVIARLNKRSLKLTATDWVKNGDRFEVMKVHRNGAIRARHLQSGRHIVLPADYVSEQVELGYACTTHTAQGVTADTMHGLLTGAESRQQAYTMLTRGRDANHAYVVVVGDGDEHTVIRPETLNPLSPTDMLERILARDESPVSATTQLRRAGDPRLLLGDACARYSDALGFAATHVAGDIGVRALERAVDDALPRLTQAATWSALRAQLLMVQADQRDPVEALARACAEPLTTAHDPCSVLAWRVAAAEWRGDRGPLPWLSRVPGQLAEHPTWGPYLAARSDLIAELADQVRTNTAQSATQPDWVAGTTGHPSAHLVADIEVWRAATLVPPSDTRPTGERRHGLAEARWQTHLETRLASTQTAALAEWSPLLNRIEPAVVVDDFAPVLAARLSQLSSSGVDAGRLLRAAASEGPLPDDHAAAALWWRLAKHLAPAVAQAVDTDHHISTAWLDDFTGRVGDISRDLQSSPWWPSLVTSIERGLQRGWPLERLLQETQTLTDAGHTDLCQAWVWRLSLLTDSHEQAEEDRDDPGQAPPADLYDGWEPSGPVVDAIADPAPMPSGEPAIDEPPVRYDEGDLTADDEQVLTIEGMIRRTMGAPDTTDADVRRMMERGDAIAESPVPAARLTQINELTATYYQRCLPGSWAEPYLTHRLRTDTTALDAVRAGYAPDGWTGLVSHLRRHGVTDTEMLTSGVAQTASTGRLIDRFRDRAVVPIVHDGAVLGFVARRNPGHSDDDNRGPKYLNTATTPVFNKGDQLYIAGSLEAGQTPVLVEGPMDAIAVTLAGGGRHVGVAPLGTSLTEQQVAQLHRAGRAPVVATDADLAGRVAAERDYWLLAMYNLNPTYAELPDGADPADLVATGQAETLNQAIANARPLGETLIDERLANLEGAESALDAVRVLAAQPPDQWTSGAQHIAEQTGLPSALIRSSLASMVRAWNANPRRAAEQAAYQASQVKDRLSAAATAQAARRNPEAATPPHPAEPRIEPAHTPTRSQRPGVER
ncbi:MAG: transfer protein Tra [Actinobacteria bacterium HGW-Actinobacteria-5]|jgi:DNA primase catalytic core|nr:MAG: transfer protein Tra [Actinobacteria bacterium HGW-Actinobacteria-5]